MSSKIMSLDLRAVSVWFYVTNDSKLRKRNHAATMYATRWYFVAPLRAKYI